MAYLFDKMVLLQDEPSNQLQTIIKKVCIYVRERPIMTSDFRVGRGRTRYVGRSKMAKNMGRQYGRSLLDALSYALIKPTHVMSESKFHAES